MKNIAKFILVPVFALACAFAAEHIVVHRVQLAGPMGTDSGHLVLSGDQLIFVDDTNPDGSFAVPRTDVRALEMNDGILTIVMARPFTNMYGQRSDVVLRVSDAASPDLISSWVGIPVNTVGEAARVAVPVAGPETIFEARHDGHHGRLIIGATGVSWQDASDPDDSRSWNYAQIKKVEREDDNRAIKIKPHNGDDYKFRIVGSFMNDTVYNMIANRIAQRP